MKKKKVYRGKRMFDVILSFIILVISLPLIIIIGLGILVSNGWPIIYCQVRISQTGKLFKMIKFRSMYKNAEVHEDEQKNKKGFKKVFFADNNDERCFPFGKLLRKSNLDELLQFINVLLGDMSIVGPRPVPAVLAKKNNLQVDYFSLPGITGAFQLDRKLIGLKEWNLEDAEKFEESYYNKTSLLNDVIIIIRTIGFIVKKLFSPESKFLSHKSNKSNFIPRVASRKF